MKEKVLLVIKSILICLFVLVFPVTSGVIISIQKLESPETFYMQSIFMLIPILLFILFVSIKRNYASEYGLKVKVNPNLLLYYLPCLLIYIPVMVKGFYTRDTGSFFGIMVLYLLVGICEELYYRGVIFRILKTKFNTLQVIIISTIIFGLGHISSAFVEVNPFMVVLDVLNALLFGLLAACLFEVSGTIIPLMLVHFLFDFETKFINLSGNGLLIAEIIRGTIMCLYGGYLLYVIIKKNKEKNYANI